MPAPHRPGLAVVTLARDSGPVIERSLKGTLACDVDEVLVLDTGSTDNTLDVASSMADPRVRVERSAWEDSFALARNHALDLVRCDLVVFVDSDEWISAEDAETFVDRIVSRYETGDAEVLSPVIREWGSGTQFHGVGRVVRRGGPRFTARVHEYLAVDGRPARYAEVPVLLWHDGYSSGRVAGRDVAARNRRLLELELADRPDDARARYFLLREGLPYAPHAESLSRLTELDRACVAASDQLSLRHYQHAARVELATQLIVDGVLGAAGQVVDGLAAQGDVLDALYLRAVIGICSGDDLHALLREAALVRRDRVDGGGLTIAQDARHLDAVIAELLDLTGAGERAQEYRAQGPPWTDAFFLGSRMRVDQR